MCETDNQWEAAVQHRELSLVLCDDLDDRVEGAEEALSGGRGIYVFLWLIRTVHQKPTQHCKVIILQLKINLKKSKTQKKIILCAYGWFTILCQFLLYNKVNQQYIYVYPLFFRFLSHLGHHRPLSVVSSLCYTEGSHYLFYTQRQQCIYINPSLLIHSNPLFSLLVFICTFFFFFSPMSNLILKNMFAGITSGMTFLK